MARPPKAILLARIEPERSAFETNRTAPTSRIPSRRISIGIVRENRPQQLPKSGMARIARQFFSRRSVALRPLTRSSNPNEAVRQPPRTRPTSSADSLHPPLLTPSCFLHNPIPAFPFDSAGREARRTAGDRNIARQATATSHGRQLQHRISVRQENRRPSPCGGQRPGTAINNWKEPCFFRPKCLHLRYRCIPARRGTNPNSSNIHY